jgi:hypothetical protein
MAITLQNPNVNGGTAVNLNSDDYKWAWKNQTKPLPIEGSYDVVETDFGGFENPKIIIKGVIDVDNESLTSPLTHKITQALLVDFARMRAGDTTLTVQLGGNKIDPATGNPVGVNYVKGRPSASTGYAGSTPSATITLQNTISVQVESIDVSGNTGTSNGQEQKYSITLHETK